MNLPFQPKVGSGSPAWNRRRGWKGGGNFEEISLPKAGLEPAGHRPHISLEAWRRGYLRGTNMHLPINRIKRGTDGIDRASRFLQLLIWEPS